MTKPFPRGIALILILGSFALADETAGIKWKKIQLEDKFYSEGATFGDFNHDGVQDVAAGGYWYEGPDFTKKHKFADYPATDPHGYSKNFLMYARDFKGDGFDDIIVVGFPGEETVWYENPRGNGETWTRHLALQHTDNESPMWGDLLGNGKPVLICMSGGKIGYAQPDYADPTKPWTFHGVSDKPGGFQRFTHGIGWGDVNGDGKADLLDAHGWYEQPASLDGDPEWKFHPEEFGDGGAQMYTYDVNGDGKPDVITSLQAHGFGLAWFEQKADGSFEKHLIIGSKPSDNPQGVKFSELHAVDLVDINGDGKPDIVTGKRWWAHGPTGDIEAMAAPVLYWFELTQKPDHSVEFVPHLIDDASGVGTQVMARSLTKGAPPAIVVGNKRGVFVFVQEKPAGNQ